MKPILEVRNLSKSYKIGAKKERYLSLRENLWSNLTSNFKKQPIFWALDDERFDVFPGDTLGIIGSNGAGKSTLLKIISRITPPTKGIITARGRVASLLEVGTGFHPELTGRENVFLNGAILGLQRSQIKNKFDEIVDFSGVEKFLDSPLKHYSSGMQLRLAFSVAAFLEPEILVVDEVLAVGDAEFQKKCLGKMEEVSKEEGRTVLFVSHNLTAIEKFCAKGLIINNGKGKFYDEMSNCLTNYHQTEEISRKEYNKTSPISKVELFVQPELRIVVDYSFSKNPRIPHLGFIISNSKGENIFGTNPTLEGIEIQSNYNITGTITVLIKNPNLVEGKYFLSIWLGNGIEDLFTDENCLVFSIPRSNRNKVNLGNVIAECEYYFQ